MGYPGTSIDELEMVAEENAEEVESMEAADSDDDDDEEKQSNSKSVFNLAAMRQSLTNPCFQIRISFVRNGSTSWSRGRRCAGNTIRSGGHHKKVGTLQARAVHKC